MDKGEKGLKWGILQGYKGKMKAFRSTIFCNQSGFITGINRGDFITGKKAQRGFKDDVFSEEMHSLKAQKPLAPCLLVKIYRGLTVAPHGDGFFLKESRI